MDMLYEPQSPCAFSAHNQLSKKDSLISVKSINIAYINTKYHINFNLSLQEKFKRQLAKLATVMLLEFKVPKKNPIVVCVE